MIAIRVRYLGPTNFRGCRLVATDGRRAITVPYEYGDDAVEKLNAARLFAAKHYPHAPPLCTTPAQFKGDDFYHFEPRANPKNP